ncbi:MAG: hypothetical protein VKP62_16725 [Candidatus Sericytochromatia bacterium]|nr:hypothetical protein [Candidatus Sericytochromatia bacterium]
MRDYRVNSIFSSVQGEGCWTGTPAIFLRLAGCNLWNGLEESRDEATRGQY